MITVVSGQITQFLEGESTTLGAGDSVYIDKDVVHGSYNDSDQPAQLAVVLAPAVGDGGYVAVDVSGEEPWVNYR
jgi:quercetin dioxygenase-like cupin family protein